MNLEKVQAKMEETVEELLTEEFKIVTSKQMTDLRAVIDYRALPYRMWYNEETLVVSTSSMGMLNYYGGFEYVDKENRSEYGIYTFFSDEDSRVKRLLDVLNDVKDEEEEV